MMKTFIQWMESNEPELSYLLAPAGGTKQIGPEKQIGSARDGSVNYPPAKASGLQASQPCLMTTTPLVFVY
jgi:hypothetical protein